MSPATFLTLLLQLVLLLLSSFSAYAQMNPADTAVKKLIMQFNKGDSLLDEASVSVVHKYHNELFAAGDVYLYALVASEDRTNTRPALKLLAKVRSLLLEDGVPDSSIRFNLVSMTEGKSLFSLKRNTVLLCYKLPENYNMNYTDQRANPLCQKDTTLRIQNGMMLQYVLCDYMGIESLPVVEMNAAVIDQLIAGSPAEMNGNSQQVLYRFLYSPNVPGQCKDPLLFEVAARTTLQQLMVEWYDDSLGRWIASDKFSLQKSTSGTFCKVMASHKGLCRVSLRKTAGINKLYIAAPEGMAFKEAKLKSNSSAMYKATFLNGGTAVLFQLPESFEEMDGAFTLIHYDGRVLYAVPGKVEKMLGKKFSIPEKYRKPVMIDGQKVTMPEDGFRFEGELDGVRTVNVVND